MGVILSATQEYIFNSLNKFIAGSISRKECALLINKTERTVSRLASKITHKGVCAVVHGNTNRVPYNQSSSEEKSLAEKIAKEKYYDFNMTHMYEKLQAEINLKISYATFRLWCHEWKLVKKGIRRQSKSIHKKRPRHHCEGFMLQMDGSEHMWWGKEVSVLIAAIDDATSDIPYAEFFKSEDTINCMKLLHEIIKIKGVPRFIYTDKAGWLSGNKRMEFTQFTRACEELGIEVIAANSSQAKGRIERFWEFAQDRIIAEMRLAEIKTTSEANLFINQYLQTEWKSKFTVQPLKTEIMYKKISSTINLNEIFCLKYYRKVASDHTVSWMGSKFLIKNPPTNLSKQTVELRFYKNGSSKMFFAGRELNLEKVREGYSNRLRAA